MSEPIYHCLLKRSSYTASTIIESESESETEIPQLKKQKIKRSKTAIHAKDTTSKKEEKRKRKLERKLSKEAKKESKKQAASSKSAAERQVQLTSKSKKVSADLPKNNVKETPAAASSNSRVADDKTIPGEGSNKTRSRNERRRRLKKAMAGQDTKENQPMIQQPQPIASIQEPEIFKSHVLQPAEQNGLIPSSSLLKKNRNKKRGFLNDIQKEQPKEHVRFQPQQANPSELVAGGTAIITSIELDPSPSSDGGYNLRSKTEKKYPVQKAPRVVKANQVSTDGGVEDLEGNTWVDDAVDYPSDDYEADNSSSAPVANAPMAHAAMESADMDEVIDYNACEVVNFTTNLPQELDVLAIKVCDCVMKM